MNTPLCFMLDYMLVRYFFSFALLFASIRVSNQISLFPATDNLVITRAFLFAYFSLTNRKKRNYIGCLHGEELF